MELEHRLIREQLLPPQQQVTLLEQHIFNKKQDIVKLKAESE